MVGNNTLLFDTIHMSNPRRTRIVMTSENKKVNNDTSTIGFES